MIFAEPLHVGKPNLGDMAKFHARLDAALERRWLTNDGPLVREFEERVAEVCGVRFAVATCNATAALELMLLAKVMQQVIAPAWTFVATAHSVARMGQDPVFCDVAPDHTLDVTKVTQLLWRETSAILGVHCWGKPCRVRLLEEVCRPDYLVLLFDAAHALGCTYLGKPLPSYGDASVVSFHATKIVNAFEGGAVLTNQPVLWEKLRHLRNFGIDGYDHTVSWGTNAKMSEVHAAMGLTNLESLGEFIGHNRENYEAYREGLRDLPGIKLLEHDEGSNYHYVVVEVDGAKAGITRDTLMGLLWEENVRARRYFYPGGHRLAPYGSRPFVPSLPVTERLAEQVLVLPTGQSVTVEDVGKVVGIIRRAMDGR